VSVKGPELLESYVGENEANVPNIFQSARDAAAPNTPTTASILFFGELDILAPPHRGGIVDGGGVVERAIATLFGELDGVLVMGATNRPELLNPSLLRPECLDRLVYLGIPTDAQEQAWVLIAQLHKLRLDGGNFELAQVAVATLSLRLMGADMSTIARGALVCGVQDFCKQAYEKKCIAENGMDLRSLSYLNLLVLLRKYFTSDFIFEPTIVGFVRK
jgi:peroxin-6